MRLELPTPAPDAQAQSARLAARIRDEIEAAGGTLGFDRFMELALYAPGLGYYSAGAQKFGPEGDFVTAPELSPLFGRCVANQCAELLAPDDDLIEFGAGSGALAAEILAELERRDALPRRYRIVELSAELKARQRATLAARVPAFLGRVEWLERLPARLRGVVVANELLDAMPVHRFRVGDDAIEECRVAGDGERFVERWEAVRSPGLATAVAGLQRAGLATAPGYRSEVNLRLGPWLSDLAARLERGALLLIDYGYTRAEYYHRERAAGTLICHYCHRAHADPYRWVGLQDITAHVDFSAVAHAAQAAGLKLGGYTTQAFFLLGNGLDRLAAESDPERVADHLRVVQQVKRLTLPTEMGERFKAIALTCGIERPLSGFRLRDLRDRL